jgi:hypothetical protein
VSLFSFAWTSLVFFARGSDFGVELEIFFFAWGYMGMGAGNGGGFVCGIGCAILAFLCGKTPSY